MVKEEYIPHRGDIVWVNFSPQSGHEQSGKRPALILSPRIYNRKSGLVLLCPITLQVKGYTFEVLIKTKGVKGVVLADQVRSIDWRARRITYAGKAQEADIDEVQEKLLTLLVFF